MKVAKMYYKLECEITVISQEQESDIYQTILKTLNKSSLTSKNSK